jgi:tellurite resistance protein TehA-like permease
MRQHRFFSHMLFQREPFQQMSLQSVPTAAAGLALGLASLGWCADQLFAQHGSLQRAAALLALPLLLAVLLKFLRAPQLLLRELAHPVAGSLLPVICMATLIQTVAWQPFSPTLATLCWWLALVGHLALLTGFLRHRLAQFALADLVPAWFIPPIGFVVAVLTAPESAPQWLLQLLAGAGLLVYLLMLPLMLYRLRRGTPLPAPQRPLLAILAAPGSLTLSGLLCLPLVAALPVSLLLGLSAVALLLTLRVWWQLPQLLRGSFNPAFAACTFPLVISATALLKLSAHLAQQTTPLLQQLAVWQLALAQLEFIVAMTVCAYVLSRYLWQFSQLLRPRLQTN